MRATVNPRTNLAHGFCCQKDLNPIDLLMTLEDDFGPAVGRLQRWLTRYESETKIQCGGNWATSATTIWLGTISVWDI